MTSHEDCVPTTITATEFKARCLDLFDQLAARKLDRVHVTKRGRVVAVLTPPDDPEHAPATSPALHGFMRGSVSGWEAVDLTLPVLDEPVNAEAGRLHE